MRNSRVFAIVLAGGEGKRLAPLTADRAKPAVPFGGNYRLVDFALSNLVNAGLLKIGVLTQYKSTQPRPPHHDDVAPVASPRRLPGDAVLGPDAEGAALMFRRVRPMRSTRT